MHFSTPDRQVQLHAVSLCTLHLALLRTARTAMPARRGAVVVLSRNWGAVLAPGPCNFSRINVSGSFHAPWLGFVAIMPPTAAVDQAVCMPCRTLSTSSVRCVRKELHRDL